MNSRLAIAVLTGMVLAAATWGFAMFRGVAPPVEHHNSPDPSVWTEVAWPFPVDQWGRGKAFTCQPADCGGEVVVYLRAKLGSCNCTTGVATDEDLDRMSDFDLVGGEVSSRSVGQPVTIGAMKGRSRAYLLTTSKPPGKSVVSIVFNDRCDMVVATAVLPHDRPEAMQPAIIAFLNSGTVSHWVEVSLGL